MIGRGVGREDERRGEQSLGISANEDMETEKPSRPGFQTECNAVCGRGRDDVWVLEDRERDSRTEVRLPVHLRYMRLLLFNGSGIVG